MWNPALSRDESTLTDDDASTERRKPGRPRSETTRRAILDAALKLLRTEHYRDISIDRIALDAKVGKQSIYRWWPSKADLILEAYAERAVQMAPPPNAGSGDAFADLEGALQRLFEIAADGQVSRSVRSFIAEAQFDEAFRAKFYEAFVSRRHAFFGGILERGVAGGQLRPDLDIEGTMDVILGAFWFRLLSGSPRPLDAAYARLIVDLLRPGLCAPGDVVRPRKRR